MSNETEAVPGRCAMTDLTDAENAALAVWTNAFSGRKDAVLAAVREAVRITERRHDQSEGFRVAAAEHALYEIADMLRRFDTPGDAGRTRAFVGDLSRIVERARVAVAGR